MHRIYSQVHLLQYMNMVGVGAEVGVVGVNAVSQTGQDYYQCKRKVEIIYRPRQTGEGRVWLLFVSNIYVFTYLLAQFEAFSIW